MNKRINIILAELAKLFPEPKTALHYSNELELLIAVMLSAQCTDKKVNEVTSKLFKKYRTLNDYATAPQEEFEQDIRSTGFYKNKAKNVIATAKLLRDSFGSEVPQTMEELITLPGVARKTANVVLGEAFGIYEGIAVDTHVKRLSNKFKLTTHSDPTKIEQDLMEIIPRSEWRNFTLRMIDYGREYSPARKKNDTDDPVSVALAAEGLL